MHKLLTEYCHTVAKLEGKTLSEKQYEALRKRYRTTLTQGKGELPPVPPRKKGQRGRVTGANVSRYGNGFRVEDACERLMAGEAVTNAMLSSDFNTRSNFNHEFRRITGKSPVDWREAEKNR